MGVNEMMKTRIMTEIEMYLAIIVDDKKGYDQDDAERAL